MRKDGITPPMPPDPLPHIINRLVQIGLVDASGMGEAPIGWAAIYAWQQMTGIDVMPWEANLMRHLSSEYIAERRRAESETCPAPWHSVAVTEAGIQAELKMLDDVLG